MTDRIEHTLVSLLGPEGVSTSDADRRLFASDALRPSRGLPATQPTPRPQYIVWPRSTEDVQAILRIANQTRTPVVPYGGGSGLMGGATAFSGGIVLDMRRMNRVSPVDPADRTVTAEAGAVLQEVNTALRPHGLILGHDPWTVPVATVGGAISTDSLGYLGAAYGSMGDQVLGLEAVLADGTLLKTRALPRRATGPHLERLLIGGEGCFGVITAATLRAVPIPESRRLVAITFPSFMEGFQAVCELFRLGLTPSMIDFGEELLSASPEGWGAAEPGAEMYLAFEGIAEVALAQERRSLQVLEAAGGARQPDTDAEAFWNRRHAPAIRFQQQRAESGTAPYLQPHTGARADFLHLPIPVSQVLPFREWCLAEMPALGVQVREFGLWNRPELFSVVLVEPVDEGRLPAAAEAVLRRAQDVGGSMEYVHGVGTRLAHLMEREHGAGLQVMQRIKREFDPNNVLNPGKLGL